MMTYIYVSFNGSPVFERSDKIQILKTISTTSPSTPRSLALTPGMLEFVALSVAPLWCFGFALGLRFQVRQAENCGDGRDGGIFVIVCKQKKVLIS